MKLKSNHITICSLAAAALLVPATALACEPIPQLMVLFAGPAPWGAYALKSLYGLLFVVSIKCVMFGFKEKSLKFFIALLFMFVANVLSTIPGLVGVFVMAVPSLFIFIVPPLYFLYLVPGKYIARHFNNRKITAAKVAGAMCLVTLLSILLLIFSFSFVENNKLWAFWIAKILFGITGVSLGLAITIGFEEAVICRLGRSYLKEDRSFLGSVAWANVWAMFIATGLAATAALPARFESPDFLMSLLRLIHGIVT